MMWIEFLLFVGALPLSLATCPALNLENGDVEYHMDPVNGQYQNSTVAGFSCDDAYRRNGPLISTCQGSGIWSPPIPTYDEVVCPPLPALENGQILYSRHDMDGEYPYGTIADFQCNYGWFLSGTNTTHCGSSSTWFNQQPPTCIQVFCQPLSLGNGTVHYYTTSNGTGVNIDGTYRLGTHAVFACNSPFTTVPTTEINPGNGRTCIDDGNGHGTWSHEPTRCLLLCPPTYNAIFHHGTISYDQDPVNGTYPEGTIATVTCDPDYYKFPDGTYSAILDPNQSMCILTRWGPHFDPLLVQCDIKTCWGSVLDIANGQVTFDRPSHYYYVGLYFVGTRATWSCNDGYSLIVSVSAVTTCVNTSYLGVWDLRNQKPTCGRSCPALSLDNGQLSYSTAAADNGRYLFSTTVTFSCDDGYSASGPTTRTCQSSSGNWDGETQQCNMNSGGGDGGGGGGGECFPSTARVHLENGKVVTMSELNIGDQVLTVLAEGHVMYSKIKTFMKKQPEVITTYKSLKTSANRTITLTGNHLLHVRKNFSDQFRPIFAEEVEIGDELLAHGHDDLIPVQVINVSSIKLQGAYTPVSEEGTIIVDDILASCYAYFDHDLANIGMTPMKLYLGITEWIFGKHKESTGYVNLLSNVDKLIFLLE